MSATDQWFFWASVGYLVVLLGSAAAAIWLWKLNDAYELGAPNRPARIKANMAVLSLAMIGAFASVVLFFLSQRANSEAAAKTEEARGIANSAQKQAGQAVKDAGEANERAGKANERAAKLEAANLKLEAQLQPRRFARLEWPKARLLFPFIGQKIVVQSYSLDAEAAILGSQIIDILSQVGLDTVDRRMSIGSFGGIAIGTYVYGNNSDLANNLVTILNQENIKTSSGAPPSSPSIIAGNPDETADVIIFVGVKPPA